MFDKSPMRKVFSFFYKVYIENIGGSNLLRAKSNILVIRVVSHCQCTILHRISRFRLRKIRKNIVIISHIVSSQIYISDQPIADCFSLLAVLVCVCLWVYLRVPGWALCLPVARADPHCLLCSACQLCIDCDTVTAWWLWDSQCGMKHGWYYHGRLLSLVAIPRDSYQFPKVQLRLLQNHMHYS